MFTNIIFRKEKKLKTSCYIFLILTGVFFTSGMMFNNIHNATADSGTYEEYFSTTTYMDISETNITGWGDGQISNPKEQITYVSTYDTPDYAEKVFITGDYAYIAEHGRITILNISIPSSPSFLGQYTNIETAYCVWVSGDYAYTLDVNPKKFIVLNVTDPTTPSFVKDLTLVGYPWGVHVSGNYAYITSSGALLEVVDISDPLNPTYVSSYGVGSESAMHLYIEGDYAYISNMGNGINVVDISNPSNPTSVANYSTDPEGAFIEGDYGFITCREAGLEIIDISDPTSPTFVSSYDTSFARDVWVSGDYAYIADRDDGLVVVNITTLSNPISAGIHDLPANARSIRIDGNLAFVPDYTSGLRIFEISDQITPTHVATYGTPQYAKGVDILGDYVFVADYPNGVRIANVSDPTNPIHLATRETNGEAHEVFVSGDYCYVADGSWGLCVIDISNIASPSIADFYSGTQGWTYDIFVEGNYAFLATEHGLEVIDITNPTNVQYFSNCSFSNRIGTTHAGIFVQGNYVYIAAAGGGLRVVDITDLSNPNLVATYSHSEWIFDVFISGDYAYLGVNNVGLVVLNITDPTNPTLIVSDDRNTPGIAITISGNYAYLAAYNSGLRVLNITDPANPSVVGGYNTPMYSGGVVVSGDYAYVTDGDLGSLGGDLFVIEVKRNRDRQHELLCVAQSETVHTITGSAFFESATLTVSDSIPSETSIIYYLSCDNGIHWEQVNSGEKHIFTYTGTNLKWKSILSTTNSKNTPSVSYLSISYNMLLESPNLLSPSSGTLTSDTTPLLEWQILTGADAYLLQIDDSSDFTSMLINTTISSPTTSYTPSPSLSDGIWYWRVAGIDSQIDRGVFSSIWSISVDSSAPYIDTPDDVTYEQGTTNNEITWQPSDAHPKSYNVTRDGTIIAEDDNWLGGNIVVNVDDLTLGSYTYICTVYDQLGLSSNDIVVVYIEDTSSPVIDHPEPIYYDEGSTGNFLTWNPSDYNPSFYTVVRDGTILVDSDIWDGSSITVSIDSLPYGSYEYNCTVYDTEGLWANDVVIVYVEDKISPEIDEPDDITYVILTTDHYIAWIATDLHPDMFSLYLNGQEHYVDTWISGDPIIYYVDGLEIDIYNFTIVVYDEAGNSAKDTVIVTVIDAINEFRTTNSVISISIISFVILNYLVSKKRKRIKVSD